MWTCSAAFVELVVPEQSVHLGAINAFPIFVTVLRHFGVEPSQSLDELTSMFSVRKVEEAARNGTRELGAESNRAGERLLSQMGEFLHDLADDLRVACRVGGPLHGGEQLCLVLPVETHDRALSVVQLAVNLNVGSRGIGILGRIGNVFPPTRLSVSVVSLSTSAFPLVPIDYTVCVFGAQVAGIRFLHAGNAVAHESRIAGTFESANRVRAGGVGVTVITVSIYALVHVMASSVHIFESVVLTDALSVFTVSICGTGVAGILFPAVPSVSVVSRFADAHLRGGISLIDAICVGAALCTWVDFLGALIPVTLVSFLADAHFPAVSDLAVGVAATFETGIRLCTILSIAFVSLLAFACPVVAVSVLGTFRTRVFLAVLSGSDPSGFASALFHSITVNFAHRLLVAFVTGIGNALKPVSRVPRFADAFV